MPTLINDDALRAVFKKIQQEITLPFKDDHLFEVYGSANGAWFGNSPTLRELTKQIYELIMPYYKDVVDVYTVYHFPKMKATQRTIVWLAFDNRTTTFINLELLNNGWSLTKNNKVKAIGGTFTELMQQYLKQSPVLTNPRML